MHFICSLKRKKNNTKKKKTKNITVTVFFLSFDNCLYLFIRFVPSMQSLMCYSQCRLAIRIVQVPIGLFQIVWFVWYMCIDSFNLKETIIFSRIPFS